MISNRVRMGQVVIVVGLCGLLAACASSGPLKVTPGPAAAPKAVEAIAVFPFEPRMKKRPGLVYQKTWDVLETIRQHGEYVAIGPTEFHRSRDALEEPFRATTLIRTAQRLGIDPEGIVVLEGGATEQVQQTGLVVEGHSGGVVGAGHAGKTTVVADITAHHPGQRKELVSARIALEEDPLTTPPDHAPRPALPRAGKTVVRAVLDDLAERAPGADPPRDWGFACLESPVAVLKGDPEFDKLDVVEKELQEDRLLRYFHHDLDATTRDLFKSSPPHALVVTDVEGSGEPPEGLRKGDVITAVNGEALLGAWHLDRVLRFAGESPKLEITIRRKDEEFKLAWKP